MSWSTQEKGFRFPLLNGCAQTLTMFLKHTRNTFNADFECIPLAVGHCPIK